MVVKEEDIEMMGAVCGASPEQARQWLERYDDIAAATDKYLDTGGVLPPLYAQNQNQQAGGPSDRISGLGEHSANRHLQMNWDENMFSGDRDTYGPENRPSAPAFEIQAPDQVGQRPNSRVGQWLENTSLTEDEQLRLAMEQSKQETGTADVGTSFQRVEDTHNQPSYQMTQFTGYAFNMDDTEPPPPTQRQRSDDGAPVFIRPSLSKAGHLAPLLTILHNIPLAREILLGRNAANVEFGSDSRWWNGKSIDREDTWSNPATPMHVLTEVQRLIAAMDETDRAYLSIDSLEADIKELAKDRDPISGLFEALVNASDTAMTESSSQEIFAAFHSRIVHAQDDQAEPDDISDEELFSLQIVPNNFHQRPNESLLSILSKLFTTYRNRRGYPYFRNLAHVLIIQAEPPANQKFGAKIPASFNARRFLKDPPKSFTDVLEGYMAKEEFIKMKEEEKRRVSFLDDPKGGGRKIPYDKLLDAAIRHLTHMPVPAMWQVAENKDKDADLMDIEDGDADAKRRTKTAKQKVLEARSSLRDELKGLKQRAADDIISFDDHIKRTHEQLIEYQHKFDADFGADDSEFEYQLSGVSTSYDVTYVLVKPHRNEDDLLITDEEDLEPQWWRIEFTHGSPCSFSSRKVREVEVRKAATDTREPLLLVYSDPYARSQGFQDLPPALKTFVEVDNENFQLELQGKDLSNNAATSTDQEMVDIAVDPSYIQDQGQAQSAQVNWGGDLGRSRASTPGPPQLPPRSAQPGTTAHIDKESSPTRSEQSSKQDKDASKKRGSRWTTGIKNVLSRSKSRERSAQVDLLTDTVDQARGAAALMPDGKLAVPGKTANGHEDKKSKR